MLSAERRRQIMCEIEQRGSVKINQLSEQFGVSAMTIRRDLDYLESEHKIVRTHGGAMLLHDKVQEYPHKIKFERNVEAKKAIAMQAVKLIGQGQSVIIDAGTTNFYLAKQLVHVKDVLLITNDVKIALELGDEEDLRILLTGGLLKQKVYSLEGHSGVSMLASLHADTAFIGCDAFDLEWGAMTSSLTKVTMKQAMLRSAQRKVLIADSSKFQQRALSTFASLEEFHVLITDHRIPNDFVETCQERGIEVIVAISEEKQNV
jgi:DeoR/GlpR family transcriptional regulator of sugar metabolism